MLIQATVQGDKALGIKLADTANGMPQRLARAAAMLGVEIEAYIKREQLSGQSLRVVTGRLRRSIHHGVRGLPDGVEGRVYSAGVPYARIQNDGGRTAAHIIEPKTASVLAFQMGGRTVFAKRVNHPGSTIKATRYMEKGLAAKRERIREVYNAAAMGSFA